MNSKQVIERKTPRPEGLSKGRCEATEEGMGAGHGLGLGGSRQPADAQRMNRVVWEAEVNALVNKPHEGAHVAVLGFVRGQVGAVEAVKLGQQFRSVNGFVDARQESGVCVGGWHGETVGQHLDRPLSGGGLSGSGSARLDQCFQSDLTIGEVTNGQHVFGRDAAVSHLADTPRGKLQVGGKSGCTSALCVKPCFEFHGSTLDFSKA